LQKLLAPLRAHHRSQKTSAVYLSAYFSATFALLLLFHKPFCCFIVMPNNKKKGNKGATKSAAPVASAEEKILGIVARISVDVANALGSKTPRHLSTLMSG
jgi:hypothetical protein